MFANIPYDTYSARAESLFNPLANQFVGSPVYGQQSPVSLQAPFNLFGAPSGHFGARNAVFGGQQLLGGAASLNEIQEVAKDLMIDRHRDFHHLEIINDLVDARSHGRQIDNVIQGLVQGQMINPQQLAQILLKERQYDHASDNIIRTITNESQYNRRADEILANVISGRPHLRRFDETVKNQKDDAFDAIIDNKAGQIILAANQGNGWLPVSRNRIRKNLTAVRELMTPHPIVGNPVLNFVATAGPAIAQAVQNKGFATAIDQMTNGGQLIGTGVRDLATLASPLGACNGMSNLNYGYGASVGRVNPLAGLETNPMGFQPLNAFGSACQGVNPASQFATSAWSPASWNPLYRQQQQLKQQQLFGLGGNALREQQLCGLGGNAYVCPLTGRNICAPESTWAAQSLSPYSAVY